LLPCVVNIASKMNDGDRDTLLSRAGVVKVLLKIAKRMSKDEAAMKAKAG
jgi:hypothetical protein